MSWDDCVRTLMRLGLTLPSEAQWENGCRAGSATAYSSGNDPQSLRGLANLADQWARDHGNDGWNTWEAWLSDGNTVHAEVGSYRPNALGLHDTHGSVWEWCLGGYAGDFYARSPSLDPLSEAAGARYRVYRGNNLGLRPARSITAARLPEDPPPRVHRAR